MPAVDDNDEISEFLNLAEFIRSVQNELEKSQKIREAVGQEPLFEFDELEVEAAVIATESSGSEVGMDIKVINGGISETSSVDEVNRVSVRLSKNTVSNHIDGALPRGLMDSEEDA